MEENYITKEWFMENVAKDWVCVECECVMPYAGGMCQSCGNRKKYPALYHCECRDEYQECRTILAHMCSCTSKDDPDECLATRDHVCICPNDNCKSDHYRIKK